MSEKEIVQKHPSFGNITVGRISGQTHLFGSDVKHQHFVEISIREGEVRRHLSMNWYSGRKKIVSVWLTEMQWAQFVSSFNQGEGTPCTIRDREGHQVEQLPEPEDVTSTFEKEINQYAADTLTELQEVISRLRAVTAPGAKSMGKKELFEMMRQLEISLAHVTAGMPFIEKQFAEAMESKMVEAKTAFEGYMNNRLREMGLESRALQAAKDEAPKLLTGEGV